MAFGNSLLPSRLFCSLVVKSLIEKLGREGGQLATGLVEQLGVVCGALIEAEEEEESTNVSCRLKNNNRIWELFFKNEMQFKK